MTVLNIKYYSSLLQNSPGVSISGEPWSSDWLLYVTIIPLILYAIVVSVEKLPAIWLTKVVFSNRYASTAYRNRSSGGRPGHMLLLIMAAINLATIAYFFELSYDLFFFSLTGISIWLLNLGVISLSVAIKFLVISAIGELTGTRDAFDEYGFNISQFYKFLAIPLLLINFFIPYFVHIPDVILLVLAAGLFIIMLIFRALRLVSIFRRRGFSLLYMILYLCALEITPILVFVKYFSGVV